MHENTIGVVYDATNDGNQQGTIKITATWGLNDFSSQTVLFKQTAIPGGPFGDTTGGRFYLELSLVNNTGQTWQSFIVNTIDNSVPPNVMYNEGSHIAKAHFHISTVALMGTGFDANATDDFDNMQAVIVKGGTLHATGATLGISDFFLHERNLEDANNMAVARQFTLVLTPQRVPEVSSCALFLLFGAVTSGLALYRRQVSSQGFKPQG